MINELDDELEESFEQKKEDQEEEFGEMKEEGEESVKQFRLARKTSSRDTSLASLLMM